jgi:mannose-1-phosphate guanylyltransferase
MKAVILIGGEGTRLRPLTYLTPKPMLPLANRPFMENFISWLRYHGIKDIFFSAGYLSEKFKNYFGDGTRFGVRITFVEEKEPLDTCGGVKNVGKYLGDDSFFVFNGDILSSLNLTAMAAFHKEKKADITISLTPVDDPTSYGLVLTDEESRVLEFLEKPGKDAIVTNLINAGVYIIEPHIMELVPEGERYSFERELFPGVLSEGYRVFGYVSDCYWLDVGTPQKYLKANQDILYKKVNFDFPSKEIMENIYIGKGTTYLEKNFVAGPVIVGNQTKIDENARIMPLSVIGDRCYLSGGTEISESVIFNDCKIGKKCFIKNSIISNNVVIDDNVIIDGCSIVGDNSRIGRGNILKNGIKIGINSIIPDGQITF